MKRRSAAFRLSKQQLAARDALAADIREKTKALNAAIAVFNQAIEPLSRTVIEAQDVSFSKVDFSGLPKSSSTVRRGGDPKRMLSELGPNTALSRRTLFGDRRSSPR
jgi:hypothetical protein